MQDDELVVESIVVVTGWVGLDDIDPDFVGGGNSARVRIPHAGAFLPRGVGCGGELVDAWVISDHGEAAAGSHHLEIGEDIIRVDVAEKPAKPIGLVAPCLLEAEQGAGYKTLHARRRLGRETLSALGCIEPNQPNFFDRAVDAHAQRVTLDHLDELGVGAFTRFRRAGNREEDHAD